MPWTDYLDKVEDGKYNFRIYLTEKAGVVLGANFMQVCAWVDGSAEWVRACVKVLD